LITRTLSVNYTLHNSKHEAAMSLNHVRPWRNIYRRKSRQIHVGNVPIGGDAPIAVQTMTNTLTTDVAATIAQVQAAAEAGADIVRVSVPDQDSSKALKEIVKESPVPYRGGYSFPLQTRD
jgi:(E)-4-hydroxy-3-methylbut-2-enyl-diphosphate synthase